MNMIWKIDWNRLKRNACQSLRLFADCYFLDPVILVLCVASMVSFLRMLSLQQTPQQLETVQRKVARQLPKIHIRHLAVSATSCHQSSGIQKRRSLDLSECLQRCASKAPAMLTWWLPTPTIKRIQTCRISGSPTTCNNKIETLFWILLWLLLDLANKNRGGQATITKTWTICEWRPCVVATSWIVFAATVPTNRRGCHVVRLSRPGYDATTIHHCVGWSAPITESGCHQAILKFEDSTVKLTAFLSSWGGNINIVRRNYPSQVTRFDWDCDHLSHRSK